MALLPVSASAKITSGKICKKPGMTLVSEGHLYRCALGSNGLVWTEEVRSSEKKLRSTSETLLEPISECKLDKPSDLPMDDGPNGSVGFPRARESMASTGVKKGLLIYVEFPDALATQKLSIAWRTSSIPIAEKFFRESSYGKFELQVDQTKKIYQLSKPTTYYNLVEAPTGGPIPNAPRPKLDEVIQEAMNLADADIDYSQYLFVTVASPSSATLSIGGATGLGPNPRDFDGVTYTHASFQALNGITPTSKKFKTLNFTHDIGHLLGLMHPYPDVSPVHGAWDIMWNFAYQNDFLGWNKWKLNWIEDDQVACLNKDFQGKVIQLLSPIGKISNSKKMVVLKTSHTSALVIEVRRKSSFDKLKSIDEGVIVYSVDVTKSQAQGPFSIISNTSKVINCENFTCVLGTMKPGENVVARGFVVRVLKTSRDGDFVSVERSKI